MVALLVFSLMPPLHPVPHRQASYASSPQDWPQPRLNIREDKPFPLSIQREHPS